MAQKVNPELTRNLAPYFVRRGDPPVAYRSTANVSNPPTDAELDAAFDAPGNLPDGFVGLVDDAGAGTAVWLVLTRGSAWWYAALTKAV